jgi:Ca-activated chloride channel family protein
MSSSRTCSSNLLKDGMLDKDGKGKLRLTPRAVTKMQRKALMEVFANLRSGQREGHEKVTPGLGGERIEGTKPYQYGDPVSELDLHQTLHNALPATGLPASPRRQSEDQIRRKRFRAAPARRRDQLLDGRAAGHERVDDALRPILSAKKVAMAMQALVRSGFRRIRSISSASIPARQNSRSDAAAGRCPSR